MATKVKEVVLGSGKVKFFNQIQGYGFISTTTDPAVDYFFHYTGMVDKVQKDDLVTFELEEGQKGMKATKVKLKV